MSWRRSTLISFSVPGTKTGSDDRISSNYHYLDNRLRIGENVAINRWTQTLSPAGVDENAIKQHPAKTVYDENGNYNDAINDVLGEMALISASV